MLLRLLVFVFAINAFASPAIACDMMNDTNMSSMPHDMSTHDNSVSKMECSIDQNHSCTSNECISSCATSFPLLSLDVQKNITFEVVDNNSKERLLSLYEIFLPVSTPPPLV